MTLRTWTCSLVLVMVGCAHKPETKKEAAPEDNGPKPISNRLEPTSACKSDLDCGPRQLCIRNQCVDITANLAECGSVRIHFGLDSSDLPPETANILERSARCLKADMALHVTIEGNADERGTEEYNMALGDRRATAVSKYLQQLGASGAQLKTVSYGKENPLCVEHDEDCWGKNRRAELNVAGGSGKKPQPAKKK